MQAIILAAGMGKRLQRLTRDNTKCMVKVNGKTIIERMLYILDRKGLSKIILVIGYEGKKLVDYIHTLSIKTPIRFIHNPIYYKTNNIYSLALAKEYLIAEDTLLLESDLIFEEKVIDILLEDKRETLALVDKFESWMDGTCMILDQEDCICDFIAGKHLKFSEREHYYKTVNIYKFSSHFSRNTYVPFLEAYEMSMGNNEYYESVIKLIALLNTKELQAKRLSGQIWYEIDDIQDLDIAESLFADTEEKKLQAITKRYGGYWRYPKLLDFCYLVNPYYPSERMEEEIRSNFKILLTNYPSGQSINNLLAAKNFCVNADHIIVGNGAAELIFALMESLQGKAGFIRPTFEEYPNRYNKSNSVYMEIDNEDFRYVAADIISYFDQKPIDFLVLINPDNPSGNFIDKEDVEQLLEWCRKKKAKLILDESFVDFVDNEKSLQELTMLSDDILEAYQEELFVIKSISKSYGIPGIRLGILASANKKIMNLVRQKLSIWNINSFGEFYMQIAEKYKNEYTLAIEQIKKERKKFQQDLKDISFLRVLPSQANYFMCELRETTSRELAVYLLGKNILIKDLTEKIGNGRQYIRLAVRCERDNHVLVANVKEFEKQIYQK